MKIEYNVKSRQSSARLHGLLIRPNTKLVSAFTLIEIMITLALILILVVNSFCAILYLSQSAARLATYTSAMAVVEGRIEAIRAATYNPPIAPFGPATVTSSYSEALWLDNKGQNLLVTGIVVSVIRPVAAGHLVTVTGNFATPRKATVVSLETIVNRFSGGQQ